MSEWEEFKGVFSPLPSFNLLSLTFFQLQVLQEDGTCLMKHKENPPRNDTAEPEPTPQVFFGCWFYIIKQYLNTLGSMISLLLCWSWDVLLANTRYFLHLVLRNLSMTTVPATKLFVWLVEFLRRTRVREVPLSFHATKKQTKINSEQKTCIYSYGTKKI